MPRARVARDLGRLVLCRPGTSDKVSFAAHAGQRVGASDQPGGTIIFWMRSLGHDATAEYDWCLLGDTSTNYILLTQLASNTHALHVVSRKDGGVLLTQSSGYVPTTGKLHCIVIAWDGAGLELYVDGVSVMSAPGEMRPNFPATVPFMLGSSGSASFTGNGEVGGEACLFARKLTKGEVEAHYYNAESPDFPAACWGPRGWVAYAVNGTVAVTAGSGSTGVVTNGTTMPERAERAARLLPAQRAATRTSVSTAGVSCGWVVADATALKPQSFSVECRARFDNFATGGISSYRGIVVKASNVLWNDGWGLVEVSAATGVRTIRMYVGNYGNGTTYTLGPSTREVHIAGTYDYVSGLAQMYVDGQFVHSWNAGAGRAQAAVPMRFMHGFNGTGGYQHEGTVRDVRYYSVVLTPEEIEARCEKDSPIERGLIESWYLDEVPRGGSSTPVATTVAVGRIAGFNATWDNATNASDAEDLLPRRARARSFRWRQPWASGSLRTALDASLAPGSGSFSVAATVRLVSGNVGNTNTLLICSDDASYVNGWVVTYTWAADGTASLNGYVGSAGPNATGTSTAQRTLRRNTTHRYAMVANAATGKVRHYVDGILFGEVGSLSWSIPNTPRFALGSHPSLGAAAGMQAADVRYAVGRAWTSEEVLRDAMGDEEALSGVTHAWPLDDEGNNPTSFRATLGPIPIGPAWMVGANDSDSLSAAVAAPRTENLFQTSESLSTGWTTFQTTLSVVGDTPPDGSPSRAVTRVLETVTNSNHRLDSASGAAAFGLAGSLVGRTLTTSMAIKAIGGRDLVQVSVDGSSSSLQFRLSTGAVVLAPSGASAYSVTDAGNGWWRVSITRKFANDFAILNVFQANNSDAFVFAGDPTKGVMVTELACVEVRSGPYLATFGANDVAAPPDVLPITA